MNNSYTYIMRFAFFLIVVLFGSMQAYAGTQAPVGEPEKKAVYFNTDSSQVSAEYKKLLMAHGKFLLKNPNVCLTLEGHADNRSSRAYNLLLSERRIKSVIAVLVEAGVQKEQIQSISLGEERQAKAVKSKNDLAQYRKVELVYHK